MKLTVIGSGSKGNCYLLHSEEDALIIEAGMPFDKVSEALKGDIKKVSGCIITHEHGDHAAHVRELLDHAIPCHATQGTIDALTRQGKTSRVMAMKPMEIRKQVTIGGFTVIPFEVEHDAEQPCGFYIYHEGMGYLLFVTDTMRLRNLSFDGGVNHALVECNFDDVLLDRRTDIPDMLKQRISRNHMNLAYCISTVYDHCMNANELVLIHISEGSGNAEEFRKYIGWLTSKKTYVGSPGLTIEVNRAPF